MFQKIWCHFLWIFAFGQPSHLLANCADKWDEIVPLDAYYQSLEGKCDGEFRFLLQNLIIQTTSLSYKKARQKMFSFLDNNEGEVCGVYTGTCVETLGIPNHLVMNTEHTWCQSWGADGIKKTDLHHLFPVMSRVNSRRGNKPFCYVSKASWIGGGSKYGKDSQGTPCFEPRNDHKGDAARALFYFAIRYGFSIADRDENVLRLWHRQDPVSSKERDRNEQIFEIQGNRNPFIDHPLFIELIENI